MKLAKGVQIFNTYQGKIVLINTKTNKVYNINQDTKKLIKILMLAQNTDEVLCTLNKAEFSKKRKLIVLINRIINSGVFENESGKYKQA